MPQESEDGTEKTEEPTARKLDKAAKEGQVARSTELTIAACTIIGFLAIFLMGGYFIKELIEIFKGAFAFDRKIIYSPNLLPAKFLTTIAYALSIFLPLFLILVLTAILAGSSIGGLNFQPSEMMKLGLIFILAKYFDHISKIQLNNLISYIIPIIFIVSPT